MRIKKIVLVLSTSVSLLSIIILSILEFSTIVNTELISHKNFIINLFTGIFTSSFLLVFVYFVEYSEVRKKTLRKLELEIRFYLAKVNRIKLLKYDSNYNLSEDSILKFAQQCSNLSSESIKGIIECYTEIDFFTGIRYRNKIYNELILPLQELDNQIMIMNHCFNKNNTGELIPNLSCIQSIHKTLYKTKIISTPSGGNIKYYNKFNSKINVGLCNLHNITYYKKELPKTNNPIACSYF